MSAPIVPPTGDWIRGISIRQPWATCIAAGAKTIAYGGLAAGVRPAERCGLSGLVRDRVRLAGAANGAGTAPDAKVMSLVAGMLAGADSIDDVDVLRHGAMPRAFDGTRAPYTLGAFLRAFTWGHVRQLELLRCTRPDLALPRPVALAGSTGEPLDAVGHLLRT